MLNSKTRWKYPDYSVEASRNLQETLQISPLLAKLFQARGWTSKAELASFLYIDEQDFHDPYLLLGMQEAVERIKFAISTGEKIRIYGDYDCDGVSSTALLIYVFRELGADVDYYIPNRFTEGYGLNHAALERAKAEGVQLIITVDTGIAAKEQVAYGQELGLEFIITDHHEVPEEIPQCVAVINPKQDGCTYPFPQLAGVGIAFKLAHALLGRVPWELIDLAAFGTIADLVPLVGENRLIAYHGLKEMNHTKHVGLQALMDVAGLSDKEINEEQVGFALGPRINASGRLEHADKAVQLLITTDHGLARKLAEDLDQLNRERQKLVDQIANQALRWIESTYGETVPSCLVLAEEDWNEGVLGIVASRLVNRYYVPTIVLSIDRERGEAKGSARSIAGFDIYQALCSCADLLTHFGGHPMAAGMSLAVEDVPSLRQTMIELADELLTEEDLIPLTEVDVLCQIGEISTEAVEEISRLAPYGVGNPKPIFVLENLSLNECRPVGADGAHLKCVLEQEGELLDGIGFGWGKVIQQISMEAKVDVLGELTINEWNGLKKPQIMIKDLRVKEQQFFDWRGQKQIESRWSQIAFDQQAAVCLCRANSSVPVDLPPYLHRLYFDEAGQITSLSSVADPRAIDTFILYDLPQSLAQGQHMFRQLKHAKRFYLLFQQDEEHFFSYLPNREEFKWYYAFLKQQRTFNLERDGSRLASLKGWTVDMLQFMTEVFIELQFARLHKGIVILQDNPPKQELTNSYIYQQKLNEVEIEKELLYSSFAELRNRLELWMMTKEQEEMAYELKR